ncbi:MAG: peptide ABC transporter substrate-binding protein [Clostridia bacterium]|nr:peptide ABC transporter substrate-binding protein [Clostridia bacterium]
MKKVLSLIVAIALLLTCCLVGCNTTNNENKPDATAKPGDATAEPGYVTIVKGAAPTIKYIYNTSEGHKAIAEYIQAALANVGLTMNLENQEWNTFLNTRKDGNYNVARNGWVADYTDPICFIDMWTSNSGNNDIQFGKGEHANLKMYNLDLTPYGYDIKVTNGTWAETYDVLVATIKGCVDNVKRYELMHLAEDMLMDTGCIVPVYYYTDLLMISKEVKGFYSSPLGYKYFNKTSYKDNSSISVCIASEPDTIDPALNSAVDGATLCAHLFAGLAKWDIDADGNLKISPDCVESLVEGVVGEDGKVTYTYTLKEGLKWSDGQDLKASDFVFAWNRAASEVLGADYGYMFEVVDGYGTDKLNVEAVDDRTLKVVLSSAISYWDELLAFPTYFPVREDVVGNEAWATNPSTYICNGPYTMTKWDHDSQIVLTKNANYHDAANVTMNEIKFFLSSDTNTIYTNFVNGSWQMIDDVPTNEIENIKKTYPDEFKINGQIGTYYVCFNVNKSLLPSNTNLTGVEAEKANQEIRKAIGLLLDRNYICESIAQGGQVPASSFVAMGMTNPDHTEFYKTAGHNEGYYGYYDVSKEAYTSNALAALEILQKYYTDVKAK